MTKKQTTKPPARICQCGCGQEVRNLFAQGHDARFAGALIAALRNGDTTPARAIAAARKLSAPLASKVERGVRK